MIRYISKPTESEMDEARRWIRQNNTIYDNDFDMAVECSYALEIFDWDDHEVDSRQTHSIPTWISDLTESFFSGEWA